MSLELRQMPKSEMLRRSMRCFALGWWALLPVIGLVPALFALLDFYSVITRKGQQWNAARPYMLTGAWMAGVGVLVSLLVSVLAGLAMVLG